MISHLLIVDDTLIFCKTNPNQTTLFVMRCSLNWSYSRFENDLGKYELMHIGDMLGFEDNSKYSWLQGVKLPIIYLGFP